MGKNCKINTIETEKLQEILNSSSSKRDVLRKIGYNIGSGNYKTLDKRIEKDNLDTTKLQENKKNIKRVFARKRETCDILCKDSTFSRSHLKRRIIEEKLIEYKCDECGNKGEWNGKPLSLQLEHKNGICNDNRIENLCFLCPNCHTQTDTYAGKRNIIPPEIKNKCIDCSVIIHRTSSRCSKCNPKLSRKFDVTKEELYRLIHIQKLPFTKIGKMFGVTDNSIRKRCKTLGIEIKRNKNI